MIYLPPLSKSVDDSNVYYDGLDNNAACRKLTADLDAAQKKWVKSWGMCFNPEKSEWLLFSGEKKSEHVDRTKDPLKMKGFVVTAVTSHETSGQRPTVH